MDEQKFCRTCGFKHNCQWVYEKLGSYKGPSVALKVILAFLLPVVIFIAVIAVFQKVFAVLGIFGATAAILSVCMALAAAALYVAAAKAICSKLDKKD
jgi:hypothetical protein